MNILVILCLINTLYIIRVKISYSMLIVISECNFMEFENSMEDIVFEYWYFNLSTQRT